MNARTVVFDLDDTLYPERDFVLSGFRAAAQWLRAERGIAGFAEAATSAFDRGIRGNVFDVALFDLGISKEASLIVELVAAYRSHAPAIELYGDVPQAIDTLRRSAHDFAVLTDGYADVQRRKVAALGIRALVDVVVYSDELGGREAWKPSPRPYEAVMQQCGSRKTGYVYVADNPHKDFLTARRLGWDTVRIRRPGGEHANALVNGELDAANEITSLNELPELL